MSLLEVKMKTLIKELNKWRTRPVYTIAQAAKLADVHPITVRRWLYGSNTKSTKMNPVFSQTPNTKEDGAEVSFLQLAEIVVVGRFRQRKVKLQALRKAHEYACSELNLDYPFAWLHLKTDGIHIFSDFGVFAADFVLVLWTPPLGSRSPLRYGTLLKKFFIKNRS